MAQLTVVSPYDRSPLTQLPLQSLSDAERALSVAYGLYEDRTAWLSPQRRIEILSRLKSAIAGNREQLALQAAREGGKPLVDSLVEVERAESGVGCAIEGISRLTGSEIPMGLNKASQNRWATTYREPRGVVFSISAFNHPVNLLIHQVVTAIAAGCPVLIKPASATPMSCASLVRLLEESGLPPGYCQMILVENDVTKRLVADERIAFLSFIGSAKVGWMLRSALSPGASCALEHGGVAPVLLDETADLDDAIPLLTRSSFYHAGQVCVSTQRLFVHQSVLGDLVDGMVAHAKKLVVGDPTRRDTEVGPLIRPDEVTRVSEWVEEAKKGGGRVVTGGNALGETTYAPTIIVDPPDGCRLSKEEVFGPVLAVYGYDDLDAAIARANLKDAYFQASYFTNRLDRALSVGRRLHGTAVMINDHTAFRVDWMPFGGHRRSGLQLGGIEWTMRDMTIERMLVFRQTDRPL